MTQFYRMSDRPDESKAAIPIEKSDARRWNTPELGFGVFMTVNSFDGPRQKQNLAHINAWAVDMDEGTKEQQHKKLLLSPLVPSMIVETKRGFQAYWIAKQAKAEHYNAIVLERLVPFFGADRNARDLCRILRVPGFLHLKDPAQPFLCRVVWRHEVGYTEQQIGRAFAWVANPQAQRDAHDEAKRAADSELREAAKQNAIAAGLAPAESFWDAVYALDCEEGLRRLSGHWACRGEAFTFKSAPRGHLNIYVDGKSSPCFVDENKRIGSPSGGGPTLVQWLRWYGHDFKTVIAVLKETYPRLVEIDDAAKQQKRAAEAAARRSAA